MLYCKYCKESLPVDVVDHKCPRWGFLSVNNGDDFRRSTYKEPEESNDTDGQSKPAPDELPHNYDNSHLGFLGGIC